MPYNGAGQFNLLYNWQTDATNNLNISSSRMEQQDTDLAAGLSLCLTKDGQQTPTANLPMGGFTLLNLALASALKNPMTVTDFQNGTPVLLGTVSGTDTITAAAPIAPAAYKQGQTFRFIAAGSNATTAVTLNVNGLGAVNVTKLGATALAIGDIQPGQVVDVTHDGTQFQIKTPNSLLVPGRLLNIATFSASATYNPFAGATKALFLGVGAGGAGGGSAATNSTQTAGASGGSSGSVGLLWVPSGLASQTITIGAAGTGVSGASGNAGGQTSVGGLMVLPGGPGGLLGAAVSGSLPGFTSNNSVANAPSGTGTLLFSSQGEVGQTGLCNDALNLGGIPGLGGATLFGYNGPGSGGSGAGALHSQSAKAGGNGQNGFVLALEYS